MKVFHTTPAQNLATIVYDGLDCETYGRGSRKRTWLHDFARIGWARLHLSVHHVCHADELVTLEITIAKQYLVRWRNGIWTTVERILPPQIRFPSHPERNG